MKRTFQRTSRMWVALGLALVAAVALLPGSWRPAVAQTAGEPTASPTASATASATVSATASATTTATSTSTATTTVTATATFTATPTATSTTLPATGGTVTVPNSGLTLNFGQGALGANTRVDYRPLVSPPIVPANAPPPSQQQQVQAAQQTSGTAIQALAAQNVPPPPGVNAAGTGGLIQSVFQLDATNTANNAGVTTFGAPVTLAIVVPPTTLSLAGGNLANVQVFRFNETTRAWVQVACSAGASGLSCSTSGFSIWAMVVVTPVPAAPVAPRPAATGTGVAEDSMSLLPLAGLVLVAGGLAGAGAYAVQRRRS